MAVLQEVKEFSGSIPVDGSDGRKDVFLTTVLELFDALNQVGIRYCHWKSNLRLDWGLSGRTDLDILVDPEDEALFRQILTKYNVKPVIARKGKQYPDVHHYLGFDQASGRLFHLHVHYRLVLGEQFVKNYHLPLEKQFLEFVQPRRGINTPIPELELIVLSLRALLKYRDRDALKDILSIRSPGIPRHILDEIHWLLEQTSLECVTRHLNGISHLVPNETILSFLETIVSTPRSGLTLVRLRSQVRGALRGYQRHDRFHASLQYFREAWQRRASFLKFSPEQKMTLPARGVALALVGVDGSGKTTQCRELTRWLNWKMDVHLYYLGSKQPSALSRSMYLLFRTFRKGHRGVSRLFGERSFAAGTVQALRQAMLYGYHLSCGYDRYRRYLRGSRQAACGSIVIFDRFPMQDSLDGPKIHLAANGSRGRLSGFFHHLEQRLYRRFKMPDHLILLEVNPGESLRRKPDHHPAVIEAKHMAMRSLWADPQGSGLTNWLLINANLPLEDVLNKLKRVIWAAVIPNDHDH